MGARARAKLRCWKKNCDLEIDGGGGGGAAAELNFENCDGDAHGNEMIGAVFADLKDESDSDSSAIVNEDNSNSPIAAAISSSGEVPHRFGLTEASVDGDPNETEFVKIEDLQANLLPVFLSVQRNMANFLGFVFKKFVFICFEFKLPLCPFIIN